ncbi:hypothetical protein PR001_g26000 [Phytophthora rubi]|uniref:Uncharacterized protein n=1 Tax=Phytophthora rubi TaxID=129364 RepID=A0A6A3I070_9STRA|nr:hypothetical protein PR001_g26000 [Phytophthora rubi]KAE9035041.1 hypothetical protein PR002_g7794 [Phytophthora rubi]
MAPLTVSAGPCNVSSGDAAIGVAGMTDPSCLYGGIGCFSDHCRFCQTEATPQSSQFVSCSWSYDSTSGSGDTGDVNFILANSDEYKPESVQATMPSSNSEDEEAFEAGVVSVCTSTATDGDLAVGINITTDASCASGGIGCIDSICRFCRTTNTTQSAHLDACPVVTKVCTTTVSAGDAAVGINIISDVSCATGGVGCIDGVCRFCKVRTTEQSAQFQDCPNFVATTAPSCSQVVSAGDAAVGINIVTDTTCASGGLGCIDSVCRFCRVTTLTQAASYVTCALIGSSTSSTQAPAATTSAPTTAPAPVATVATPAPTASKQSCSQTVSQGDAAAGINIVTDSSCAYGGLGCIDQVCRFCRVTTSAQSASFIDCAAVTGTTTSSPTTAAPTTPPAAATAAPTTAPPTTVPPTTAPPTATPTTTSATSTTPSIVFECYRTVSSGDKGVGLDIVSDIRCSDGGAGCLDDVCRFCKRFDTVQSQSYTNCSSIPSANVGGDITFVPIPIVTD